MWSIVLMIFCAIILSENYLESFQNLVSTSETGAATRTSYSRLMVMAAANADESRIHKRGELNTFTWHSISKIWYEFFFWQKKYIFYSICRNIRADSIEFDSTKLVICSRRWCDTFGRYMRICLMAINSIFSIVLCGVRCNRECIVYYRVPFCFPYATVAVAVASTFVSGV